MLCVVVGAAAEWGVPTEEDVHDDAQGPHITFLDVLFIFVKFF